MKFWICIFIACMIFIVLGVYDAEHRKPAHFSRYTDGSWFVPFGETTTLSSIDGYCVVISNDDHKPIGMRCWDKQHDR